MDYVEGFSVATGQTQIKFHFPIFAAPSDLHPVRGNLPAGAQWPGKRGLFRRGLFLVHGGSFPTRGSVTSVVSGYMQRAETIQITFDPSKTSYDKLLNLFWRAHNPTEVDSQGRDTGKQYRSAIFYVDEQQRAVAEKLKGQAQKLYSKPIATEIYSSGIISSCTRKSSEFLPEKPKQSVRPANHRTEASKTRPEETLS